MDEQLGTMINTQPSPQALPDANVASLVSPAEGAKATLGNATYLQSLLLPQKGGEKKPSDDGSVGPSDAPDSPQEPSGDAEAKKEDNAESGMEERLMRQIDTLRDEVKGDRQHREIDSIRKELEDLLKEDGQEKQD